jgi:hypothetical protein
VVVPELEFVLALLPHPPNAIVNAPTVATNASDDVPNR